jgi:hypothetical protein
MKEEEMQALGGVLLVGGLVAGVLLGIYGHISTDRGWSLAPVVLLAAAIVAGVACLALPVWRRP